MGDGDDSGPAVTPEVDAMGRPVPNAEPDDAEDIQRHMADLADATLRFTGMANPQMGDGMDIHFGHLPIRDDAVAELIVDGEVVQRIIGDGDGGGPPGKSRVPAICPSCDGVIGRDVGVTDAGACSDCGEGLVDDGGGD